MLTCYSEARAVRHTTKQLGVRRAIRMREREGIKKEEREGREGMEKRGERERERERNVF